MSSVPSTMKALVVTKDKTVTVQETPVPSLAPGQILVKTQAVTLNPTDWKHLKFLSEPGFLLGCDFAGTLVEFSDGETEKKAASIGVKKGARVAGFVAGGKGSTTGSFAEYVKTDHDLVVRIPDDIDPSHASSVGVGGYTAAQALFQDTRLQMKLPSGQSNTLPEVTLASSPKLLVWAGSTSVGQWSIQLARAAGYYVITTASPKNHDLLKTMGAAEVYDYRDETVPDKISSQHPDLSLALDGISENGTQSLCVRSLGKKGGNVVVLLTPEQDAVELRKNDVQIIFTLAYSVLGHPFSHRSLHFSEEVVKKDRDFILKFTNGERGLLYQLLQHKLVSGNRIKQLDGGLEGVAEGLKLLEQGKVSAEKLAYTLS